jgi:hypothetical protein
MGNKLYVGNLPYSVRDGDLEHWPLQRLRLCGNGQR